MLTCRMAGKKTAGIARFIVVSGIDTRMQRTVSTDDAPAAVGAYSQATTNGDLVFTAGQLPMTSDGELLDDRPVAGG